MDAYAILYGIWLGLLIQLKRRTVSKIWKPYLIFLLLLLPIQYIWCLGLPPVLCYGNLKFKELISKTKEKFKLFQILKEYAWSKKNQIDPLNLLNKVRVWLFLPDYSDPPKSYRLIADFFQVFFVWLQHATFQMESKTNCEVIETAGKNEEIIETDADFKNNPYHDYVSEFRNYFDKIKFGIFMYSYWLVLATVFLTGTSRISILCMGYVILSFFFLWYGQTFLTKPMERLLKL